MFRNLLLDWLGCRRDKIIFAYRRTGFTWDFTKCSENIIGGVLTNEPFALCALGNEVTVRVVATRWYLWDYGLLCGIRCFSDGNLMKFNECRDQAACKFPRKSTARFFKAEVVSRSKFIFSASHSLWNVVAGCRWRWPYDVIISYYRMLVIVVIRVGCLWFILLQLIPRYDYYTSERAAALCRDDVNKNT